MKKPYLTLSGILKGVPFGTTKPLAKYVYQKTRKGQGNIEGDKTRTRQVRRWVKGINPKTPGQILNRARFKKGVAAWHILTPEQKQTYKKPAEKLHLNNFQLFMRIWCSSQPLVVSTVWDAGTTTWDLNTTLWD